MPQTTNLISIDDSMQAEALGSACLVAIIGTINILLIVLDRTIQNMKKGKASRLLFSDDDDEWVDNNAVDDLAALFMVMMMKQQQQWVLEVDE